MLPFKERELFIILTFNGDYLLAASLPASPYRPVVTFSSLNCTSGQARCGIPQWKQCERPGSLASPSKERLLATVEILSRKFRRRSDEGRTKSRECCLQLRRAVREREMGRKVIKNKREPRGAFPKYGKERVPLYLVDGYE